MAGYVAVELSPNLLEASDNGTTYWVVNTDANTDSATGKRYGDVHSRHVSRTNAIKVAEWLNTPTP